jgi:hypothetical protein
MLRDAASRCLGIRAERTARADLADGLGEERLHHGLPFGVFGVLGRMPPDAVLPLRTGHALALPVHSES